MSEVVKPPAYVWAYPAAVDSVYDGDTVVLHVLIHPNEGGELHEVHVRIEGINAPELNTSEGKAAREYASTILPPGTQVSLITRKRDKYGRWLGRIVLPDGSDFGELMLANGYAVPYLL